MLRITTLAFAVLVLSATAVAPAAMCSGTDAAITTVSVKSVSTSNMTNHYMLTGTVSNLGTQGQANNVLQHVDIWLNDQKLDDRSIPPLAAGQSATFTYPWTRAVEAGKGSTVMTFKLDGQGPDCYPANDHFTLTF